MLVKFRVVGEKTPQVMEIMSAYEDDGSLILIPVRSDECEVRIFLDSSFSGEYFISKLFSDGKIDFCYPFRLSAEFFDLDSD